MGKRCRQHQVEIDECKLGLPSGNGKILCTQQNLQERYQRHPEEFPEGKPDSTYGECVDSKLYGSSWRREPKNPYKPVISLPGPSFAVKRSDSDKLK